MARPCLRLLGVAVLVLASGCAVDAGAGDDAEEFDRPGEYLASVVGDDLADAIRRSMCGDLCEVVAGLRSEWQDGQAAVDDDPELAALDAEWPTCMAANGFDVTQRSELAELVINRLEPELSEGRRPSAAQQASADRLQRRLDSIDVECSIDRETRRIELLVEFEREFVDTNAAALARLSADLG